VEASVIQKNKMRDAPRELKLIEVIKNLVQRHHPKSLIPLGDDAFAFKSFSASTVIAQDMMIEGVHFEMTYFKPGDLGYKSLAVSLSDLAAMGAEPHFAQVSLAIPTSVDEAWVIQYYTGMTELADEFGIEIVGGDLCRSPGPIVIDVSVVGECEGPFTRKGAQAGDWLAVTGPLGLSHAGMLALQKELYIFAEGTQKHLRPKPRFDVARLLKRHQLGPDTIHAMMDCSDGLVNDVMHLTRNLELGVELKEKDLPIEADSQGFAVSLHQKALDWALWGGEDYELLLAFPPNKKDELKYIFEADNRDLFLIGNFNDAGQITLQTADGEIQTLDQFKGWSHF
jgi:thiamine-monophosphate kinase